MHGDFETTAASRARAILASFASVFIMAAGLCAIPMAAPAADTKADELGAAAALPRTRCEPEFRAIAQRLTNSGNPTFGTLQIDDLRRQLAQPNLNVPDTIRLRVHLGQELLRLGDIDGALRETEAAFDAAGAKLHLVPDLHRARALVHLRKAEIENCVRRHNAECCIFPLEGGAVHTVDDPARLARDDYLAYLRLITPQPAPRSPIPLNVLGCWMLNIACMALDEYPEGVPPEFRLPPEALESEYDVGRFVDVAPAVGVDTFDLAGGMIVDDIDSDGLLDIVTSTCDPNGPMTAYRNQGDGRFANVSESSWLSDQLGGLNCVAADYDSDGDVDILVLRGGWMFEDGRIRNSLLRNDGRGRFTDVTREVGLAEPAYPTQAACWADFDNDGDLDLYIGNESRVEMPDGAHADYPSQLFIQNDDGTFADVAPTAGVTNDRLAKGVAAGDFDNDGVMDLYISNLGQNRLYRNNGDLTFTDVAAEAGVVQPAGRSFATWFFDYDNDGWLDIWVGAYSAKTSEVAGDVLGLPQWGHLPCLYRNRGDGTFENATTRLGLAHVWMPMGASFGDLDNDGWLDFYLGTGDPSYESLMPNVMLRNDRGRRFQNVTKSGGFGHLQKGHGVVFADMDNDGDQDVSHQLGGFSPGDKFRNALFLNPGQGNHFITIELRGVKSSRQGVGVRIKVTVQTPDGEREIHRAPGCVSSFGSTPRRQEIGLGDATAITSLEVSWSKSGLRQVFRDVPLDAHVRVTEGDAELERLAVKRVPLGRATSESVPEAGPDE